MRNRPNLFEVMSKAPQVQSSPTKRGLPILRGMKKRSTPTAAPQLVAKALTEEEAASELAAQRAKEEAQARAAAEARERVEREKQARRQAREARKRSKAERKEEARRRAVEIAVQRAADSAARRAAERAAAAARTPAPARGRSIYVAAGNRTYSITPVKFMVAAGLVCAVILGAFAIGHRSGGGTPLKMTTVAALTNSGGPTEPILDGVLSGADSKSSKQGNGKAARSRDAELSELMTPPASVMQNVTANRPARVDSGAAAATPEKTKLNHVQIEWFQITVEKSSEDLRAELEDVHRYLKARGIESFAREHSRGFILYSAKGFRMSRDVKAERDEFLKRLQQLGQEYFRGGGRYQFKDCFFVSHGNATKGQPVNFKEQ